MIRVESRGLSAENKVVTDRTFISFRGPQALNGVIPENPAMVVVGLFLMLAARFAKNRTAPFGGKPIRPVTDTERLLLFSFGLLAFVLGLVRIIHK